jgi:6-phosphofructokinase 1
MATVRTIGISTGGGDCPGLNAAIRAATRAAILRHNWQVIGIQDGFDGLIWPREKTVRLDVDSVSGILARGGTILGTTNRGDPFQYRAIEDGREVVHDYSDRVLENARALGIDALIVIGGDGTQKIALDVYRRGLNVVGVPKTIDHDLSATDTTFGFDTAVHTCTDAIDKIQSTAESHHRVMVVEVMGRDVGWIALEAGIAGGAHVILIPEIPFTVENICQCVKQRDHAGKRFTVVVVAEGIKVPGEPQHELQQEKRRLPRRGSVGNRIGNAIAHCSQKEVRVTVLGHIQRGGSPSPFDRILSTRFGVAAVELIARGEFGRMVCLRGTRVESVEIERAVGSLRCVDPNGELVHTARSIGVCFGD